MTTLNMFNLTANGITFAAGETLWIEGQPGDLMYVITAGEVDIFVEDHLIATLGPGSVVGEMALIDRQPRSATVIAGTACTLVPIDRKQFNFLVRQMPSFATQMMQILSERLRIAQCSEVRAFADREAVLHA